jgi:hypothetical protein
MTDLRDRTQYRAGNSYPFSFRVVIRAAFCLVVYILLQITIRPSHERDEKPLASADDAARHNHDANDQQKPEQRGGVLALAAKRVRH